MGEKKVIIVGGGPAGSLTGILLSREAAALGQSINITILEDKPFKQEGFAGCNYCAGVVTNRTIKRFRNIGLELPTGVIQRRIDGFFYVTEGGAIDFPRGDRGKIFSVFRGGGPANQSSSSEESFDRFLLNQAKKSGADIINTKATSIARPDKDRIIVTAKSGEEMEADIVVGAFGINSGISRRLQDTIGYNPPPNLAVVQAELAIKTDKIDESFGNRIIAFALKHPRIRFLAVTPKRDYLTLTAVGKNITMQDINDYLSRRELRHYLFLEDDERIIGCSCRPLMPTGLASGAISDRFIAVGDAFTSRFYKNGLGSAYFTSAIASKTLIAGKYKREDLWKSYGRLVQKRFGLSNRCGKIIFVVNDIVYKNGFLAKGSLNYIRRERKNSKSGRLSNLMWSLFTGDRSYSKLLLDALNPVLLFSLLFWYIKAALSGIGKWMRSSITDH